MRSARARHSSLAIYIQEDLTLIGISVWDWDHMNNGYGPYYGYGYPYAWGYRANYGYRYYW